MKRVGWMFGAALLPALAASAQQVPATGPTPHKDPNRPALASPAPRMSPHPHMSPTPIPRPSASPDPRPSANPSPHVSPSPLPSVSPDGSDNMRFRGMDRNSDGRITREEWRGNDKSFSNQDQNGDGVLSGDEVTRPRRPRSGGSPEASPSPAMSPSPAARR